MKNIILVSCVFLIGCNLSDSKFKSSLEGDIVFTQRGSDGVSDLYIISANGANLKLVFENNDPINSNILYPYWSDSGAKIEFTAMKNGSWEKWELDLSDKSSTVLENVVNDYSFSVSRDKDIEIWRGSVYYKENKLFSHSFYEPDLNMGAYEASFSPDKGNVIFVYKGDIWVANINGEKKAKIVNGDDPDWKY